VASPVFKTGVTRPSRAGWVRFPHSPAIATRASLALFSLLVVLAAWLPRTAAAQRVDSTRAGVAPATRAATQDTLSRLKVRPGRAFLGSMLLPGSMQMKLGRPKAATLFLAVEAGTIGMSVKSWNDLRKARDARKDTVGTPTLDDSGQPVIDPVTGEPKITFAPRDPNLAGRLRARRTHLEDWLAAVFFNHLFAGADAFVAAQLSDFNTNVQVTTSDRGASVVARVAW
jgi:hypothetical protein